MLFSRICAIKKRSRWSGPSSCPLEHIITVGVTNQCSNINVLQIAIFDKQESFLNLKKICTDFFCPLNKSSYPKFLFCYPLANNEFLSFIGPLWLHLWLTIQATRGKVSERCICVDEFPVCWVVGLLHSMIESSLMCFWPKLMSHLPSSGS